MKLSDIPLAWALAGAALLALGVVLAAYIRNRSSEAEESAPADSWERSEERRRKKEMIYGSASYVLLFCCAAVAAALSFHGLVGFGRQNLNLSGGWEYLVPFGLDGAAMFCSVLAVREASHGDAALGSRMLVWTFAFASAWFNWVHAPRGLGHAGAPQFFAGMSMSAAVLFDRALKQTRRAALRDQGLVPRPLPQIRMVRWLRAPRETYGAWSLMLLEGVRSLDEAVDEVREERRRQQRNRARRRENDKLERAKIRALNRQHRTWIRRGGRQVEAPKLPSGSGQVTAEPAIASPDHASSQLPPGPSSVGAPDSTAASESASKTSWPSLRPVSATAERPSIDLTAEDDTLTLPRLDSLEKKLKDLEQQFG